MGGCRCSYKDCTNTTKTSANVHFFHYPVKHKERCKIWIDNACKPKFYELEEEQLRNKVVCEVHFEDRWFPNTQKKRLLLGAIPTLDATNVEMPDSSYVQKQVAELKMIPTNEDGTVFILDSDLYHRAPKIESYTYKNGMLVPTEAEPPKPHFLSSTRINKPSTSGLEMNFAPNSEYDAILVKNEISEFGRNEKHETEEYITFDNPVKHEEPDKKGLPRQINPKSAVAPKTEKGVNKNYLRKIKQHSRDIASIKRMLMNKRTEEYKPDNKSVLKYLQDYIPPSLHTVISLTLGDKHELSEEDIEFFTTIHRISPEAYQIISDKYQWNLPSVDIVDGMNE